MENSKKKTIGIILGLLALVAVIGVTYAFITQTLTGTKKVTITAGTLSLVLDEKNEITISDALPMYDAVGMIQEEVFNFNLINNTSNPTDYTLKLQKVATTNELSTSDVKYYLTKEGVGEPKLLSTLPDDSTIDSGVIGDKETIEYTLRLWIDSSVTDNSVLSGKSLSYRVDVEVSQEIEEITTVIAGKTFAVEESTESFPNFSEISSATNGRGIYKYKEDGVDVYYWRGDVAATENASNHVIFGGYCWEMVRTTKTGGIKMIYDGTPVSVDGKQTCPNTGKSSQLASTIAFNSSYNDNAYVGYMYGLTGLTAELASPQCIKLNSAGTAAEVGTETTEEECTNAGGKWAETAYEATHANVVNSNIKGEIDTWFSTSSLNKEANLEKIEDVVYCNDRSIDQTAEIANGWTTLGYGINKTNYNANARVGYNEANIQPSLECSQKNDRFTVNKENGNGDLIYPVGLLTLDEMVLAGADYYNANSDSDFYLNIGRYYWSLSPHSFGAGYASAFSVNSGSVGSYEMTGSGRLSNGTYFWIGSRPVISLASTATFASEGEGTESNPYVVE